MDGLKSLLYMENLALQYMFLICIVGAAAKLLISRRNKEELIKNILDVTKFVICFLIAGSTVLLMQSGNETTILNIVVIAYALLSIASVVICEHIRKKK